MRELKDANNV